MNDGAAALLGFILGWAIVMGIMLLYNTLRMRHDDKVEAKAHAQYIAGCKARGWEPYTIWTSQALNAIREAHQANR